MMLFAMPDADEEKQAATKRNLCSSSTDIAKRTRMSLMEPTRIVPFKPKDLKEC